MLKICLENKAFLAVEIFKLQLIDSNTVNSLIYEKALSSKKKHFQ